MRWTWDPRKNRANQLVVHTWPEVDPDTNEEVGRIISARKATKRERKAYRERRAYEEGDSGGRGYQTQINRPCGNTSSSVRSGPGDRNADSGLGVPGAMEAEKDINGERGPRHGAGLRVAKIVHFNVHFGGVLVARVRPTQDIRPLADFRANLAAVVRQVQRTKRPVILTQHGRSAAVLVDAAEYEALLDRAELLDDVRVAEDEVAAGRGLPHSKAKAAVPRLRA